MKKILPLLFIAANQFVLGQVDTSKGSVTFSGYGEVYYAYDFNEPDNHELPFFLYNFKRHNEFNVNLGFINANYTSSRVRANFGLMAGTYAQYNLAAEPALLRLVWQANIGLKLSSAKNVWLDAGILTSHIGFESAIGKDCAALSRSIIAENTPYYESGLRLSYATGDGKWYLAALVMNGWQRIARPDGNNTPAFGTQITFTPNKKITVNYSTFVGNDKPDTSSQMRFYNNFYGIFHLAEKLSVTLGFDYGIEQKPDEESASSSIYAPVVILRYQLTERLAAAARGEFYNDKNGIIITTGTPDGFLTQGYSVNLDYSPFHNVLWRIDLRTFKSKDDIFNKEGEGRNTDTFATTSLSVAF